MTRTITRRRLLGYVGGATGAAVVGPALLSACGAGGGGGDTYNIGAVLELSGADSAGGQLARRGYDFWAYVVNKAGGVKVGGKTYRVKVLVEDCQSQPSVAADAASRLINDKKVDAMFGSYTSGVQLAMNPICAKYQVPCLAGSAESPGNWSPHPQFTYGIIPSVDLTADRALKFIVETASPKPTSAAIIGANEPFSKDAAAGFAKGAKEAGLTITHNSLFPPTSDLSPIISSIASKSPDILAVGGHDTILINAVKTAKSVKYAPKAIIMHYGVTEPAFVQALHAQAEGVLGLVDWTPDFDYRDDVFGTAQQFDKSYRAKYKVAPDYTGAGCAVSGLVLQEALRKLGKPPGLSQEDRVKLNQLVAQTDITTFYGPIKFDKSGSHLHDNTEPPPLLVQIQGGNVVAVAPTEAAKGKLTYPRKG